MAATKKKVTPKKAATAKRAVAKAVKAHNTSVRRANAAFAKLPRNEQRVAIAKDVLAAIESGKILPKTGVYVNSANFSKPLISNWAKKKSHELSDEFEKLEECDACALGSMFVCAVVRNDNIKVGKAIRTGGHSVSQEATYDYLKQFFSEGELADIERAFEGWGNSVGMFGGLGHLTSYDRLRLIMENIVVNDGVFVPNDKPNIVASYL